MRITQKFVREVKRHLKTNWHDQGWHDYHWMPETQAVIWALIMCAEPQQPNEIVAEAKKAYSDFTIKLMGEK